jgi:hypothetical protein
MAKAATTIAVGHRALLGRIDRKLRDRGQRLRADRYGGDVSRVLIDVKKRAVVETDVDVEKLGRELGVLQPWEKLARQ